MHAVNKRSWCRITAMSVIEIKLNSGCECVSHCMHGCGILDSPRPSPSRAQTHPSSLAQYK